VLWVGVAAVSFYFELAWRLAKLPALTTTEGGGRRQPGNAAPFLEAR